MAAVTLAEDGGDLKARVVALVNSRLGDSLVGGAHSIADYRAELELKLCGVETRLNEVYATANCELADAENSREKLAKRVYDLIERQDELLLKASEAGNECKNFGVENQELLEDINCVRGVTQYTVWLKLVEEVSLDLSVSLETTDRDQVVVCFSKLREISRLLTDSQCVNLKKYVESMTNHWFGIIHDKYAAILQSALDAFGWPFVDGLDNNGKTVGDVLRAGAGEARSLAAATETLLRLEEARDTRRPPQLTSLPMRLLVRPLRKRFKYHFLGSKATNNPAKPEWFTTQLSTWALSHRQFLDQHIQPAYDRVGVTLPATMEFAQALVALACEKLSVDIQVVVQDDVLLAHTIDETIGFARDIANHMQYSASQPSVLEPLTQSGIFSRWLNMERKFAFEKVDNLFMAGENSVWESDIADSLTPRAAESFLALLLSVTERYKFLSATHHRLQFLQLQIELIEDFRVRLVQLSRSEVEDPLASDLCPILNTVHHLILVLGNWAETPFFLQLQHQLAIDDTDMSTTVFQEKIEELTYFKRDMISKVVESIFYAVRARSLKYRNETKWFSIKELPRSVSPTFCDMLQTLAFSLETARKRLVPSAFQRVWQDLADCLDSFIIDHVILCNKFSVEGVKQVELDITAGIFPILAEFSPCPQAHFHRLMDVLLLMTKSAGNLILIRDSLQEAIAAGDSEGAGANIMAELLGVNSLQPALACRLISQRIDLED